MRAGPLSAPMVEAAAKVVDQWHDLGRLRSPMNFDLLYEAMMLKILSMCEEREESFDGEIRHGDADWEPHRGTRTIDKFPDGTELIMPWREP
jgi:hypothetical protein